MFTLFDADRVADVFVPATEDGAVALAAADLVRDVSRVGGGEPTLKRFVPRDERGYLLVCTLGAKALEPLLESLGLDATAIAGGWERYLIRTFGTDGENLAIIGSDTRGTMWGIYHVCEHVLGVDPAHLWTDSVPDRLPDALLRDTSIVSEEPEFRYRGWFLNDEDLLCEWRDDGGRRYIDYPFYEHVIHQDVLARVIETALRMRQNLMIPASFVDIMNPAEENLVRMVTDRGLFVSQHHVEPLGVSHFGWDAYWAARGREIPCSFVTQRDEYLQIWRDYVERWARFPNVIWQLGLRGRGDRPVWFHDDAVPPRDADRGKLISDAYAAQHAIVADVLDTTDFPSTTTLWMEGSHLQRDGHLGFPPGVTIVFSDLGSSQMMQEDFDRTERRPQHSYGVYHHVCFWGDGPHLAQGTSVGKLAHNYRQASGKGDTHYSILNVANVREVILGAAAVAELTWSTRSFDADDFLSRWFAREFGPQSVAGIRAVYDAYFNAFHVMREDRRPDEMLLIDGMTRRLGLKLLDYLEGNVEESKLGYYRHLDEFADADEFFAFFGAALAAAEPRWQAVQRAIYEAYAGISSERRQYFTDHFVVQYETASGIYRWARGLLEAARTAHEAVAGSIESARSADVTAHVDAAASALEKALLDRRKAEHDVWRHWYRGDRKMDLPGVLERTRRYAQGLYGRPKNVKADSRTPEPSR